MYFKLNQPNHNVEFTCYVTDFLATILNTTTGIKV